MIVIHKAGLLSEENGKFSLGPQILQRPHVYCVKIDFSNLLIVRLKTADIYETMDPWAQMTCL